MRRLVTILMGSESDRDVKKRGDETLADFGVDWETNVLSAHRTPEVLVSYIGQMEKPLGSLAEHGHDLADAGLMVRVRENTFRSF